MDKKNISYTYIVLMFFIYIIICFNFRLLLPFGFEPDFNFRVAEVLSGNGIISNIYNYMYGDYDFVTKCKVLDGALSLWNFLPSILCGEDYYLKVIRWLFQITIVSSFFVSALFVLVRNNEVILKKSLIILVSLFFPGLIYFLGVFGFEQLSLFVSLWLLFFIDKKIISLILIFIVYNIDSGSAIILLLFFMLYVINIKLVSKFTMKKILLINVLLIVFSFIIGMALLPLIYAVPVIGPKAYGIFNDYSTIYSDVSNKYPLIFRPIITYMTAIFMTPEGVKVIIPYFIYLIFGIYGVYKLIISSNFEIEKVTLISAITTILIFVFMLPGFSNAKYYIFLVPFIIYSLSSIYKLRSIFICNAISSIIVLIFLVFYRL